MRKLSGRFLLLKLAFVVLAALFMVGCAPTTAPTPASSPSSTPAPTATPRSTSTPTPAAIVISTDTSIPTQQPTGVSSDYYEAFASGLASTFTKGDICSLEQPFVLEGDALPVSSGLVASFTPSSATQGAYTYTNNILDGECVDSSNGTYVVTFYSLGEGDIIMTGVATRVCKGVTVLNQTTESRVAIREAPNITCP